MPGLSKPILAGPVKIPQIKSIHGNYHISITAQKYKKYCFLVFAIQITTLLPNHKHLFYLL